jgi:hypothetical protein
MSQWYKLATVNHMNPEVANKIFFFIPLSPRYSPPRGSNDRRLLRCLLPAGPEGADVIAAVIPSQNMPINISPSAVKTVTR